MVSTSKQKKEVIEITGPTNIVSVIGADTYFGSHMVSHLVSMDRVVYGFSQRIPFSFVQKPMIATGLEKAAVPPDPIISDWLFVCIDPDIGFDQYLKTMRSFCKEVTTKEYWGRICFLSLGGICKSGGDPISEDSIVLPRTDLDLSLATAENLLSVMKSNEKNLANTTIVRIGVPYGNETDSDDSCSFVNQFIKQMIAGEKINIPFHQMGKRSFTHIADICDSIIQLMSLDFCPDLINIPGEVLTVQELLEIFSEYFDLTKETIYTAYNDQYFFLEDQHLSDVLFKQTINCNRRYSLRKWLNELNRQQELKCLMAN